MASRRLAMLIVAAVPLFGCHDFGVVNQYDPRYPIRVTITGPDTTYSTGQVLTFTLSTTPAWTGAAPVWSSSMADRLTPIGDGRFRVSAATFTGNSVTITAGVGPHQGQKSVMVQQRVASLRIDRGYPTGDSISLDAFDLPFSISPHAYDSAGVYVDLPATEQVRLTSRDTQVVRVLAAGPRSALDSGRTWLVASYAGASDSIPVHVFQMPDAFTCSPAAPISLAYNDSVRPSITGWYDATGHPMQWTPVLTGWQLVDSQGPLTMSSDSVVHAGSMPAQGYLSASWTSPDSSLSGNRSGCYIFVPYP